MKPAKSKYDGAPCKKGHGTLRWRANGTCVVCNKLQTAASKATKKQKSGTRYHGGVCAKHPELKGLRLTSNYTCVYCHRDRSVARQKRNGYPVMRRVAEKLKREALVHYGQFCQHCSESDPDVLTIDHTDQKGNKHFGKDGKRLSGSRLYRWLRANRYPPGFRVLCFNHNIKAYCQFRQGVQHA